jgi:mannose-6-phosphate isomerase-like protein (cupin superfamily)
VTNPDVCFKEAAEILRERARLGQLYHEFLRFPSMSAGMYVLAKGAEDRQSPHNQDELYYVLRGRGRLRAGDEDREVRPGSLMFVAAHVAHRFHDIEEELELLVFFAPAEVE